MANVATAIRSDAGFEATKLRAAAIALRERRAAHRLRAVDREARRTSPRRGSRTGRSERACPFSRSVGACELGPDVETGRATDG